MSASIIFPFLLGIIVALGVNYLSDVLPLQLRLTAPTCANQGCQKSYSWSDYLLFRKCAACGKKRSLRTFIVLGLCIASSLYLWLSYPTKLGYFLSLIALNYFYLVAVIDLEYRLILRPLSLFGLALAALAGYLLHGWLAMLIGGVAGFAIMFLFYLGGKLFTRIRARRIGEDPRQAEEALGSGDVTLSTILGLLLGWPLIWFGLLAGALIAGIVSIIILLVFVMQRRYSKQAFNTFIPLGPMFILSAILITFLPQFVNVFLP